MISVGIKMGQDKPVKSLIINITVPFVSIFCLSYVVQQGDALLWSSWLEKHPEMALLFAKNPETGTALWDDPDTKAVWEKHVEETYHFYWEQYTYWTAQGWTIDQSFSESNNDGEAAAIVMDRVIETYLEEWKDGPESKQNDVKTPHSDTEVLNYLFRQNCTLEAGMSSVMDGQCEHVDVVGESCGSDDPHDGGNYGKRPASSQQNTADHRGKKYMCVSVCFVFYVCCQFNKANWNI